VLNPAPDRADLSIRV